MQSELAKVKVLVVDDAPEVRRLLCHRLPIYGRFEIVAEAADGEEGIARAKEIRPDLVVLDVVMPGRSGVDVAPEIRAASPCCRILLYSSLDTLSRANPSRIGVDVIVDKAESLGGLEGALAQLFPEAMDPAA
ncbi:MAG TPA: response regulator transcription factor [Acidimicrobiales bacterium]|nr:response regulator transcription factor [Acidimicrobiales bacterium]